MSILCATNFSDAAREASTTAALLARKRSEPLVLFHRVPGGIPQALAMRMLEAARQTLASEQDRLSKLGARVSGRISEGSLSRELPAVARELGASMVVVGDEADASGFGGPVDRLAMGTQVPLLVVKSARGFREWLMEGKPLQVTVAVDRGAASDAALAWVAALEAYGPLEITVAHLYAPRAELARTGIPGPKWDGELAPELQHEVRRRVETQVKEVAFRSAPRLDLRIETGEVGRTLLKVASEARADLIVLGRRATSLLAWPASAVHRALADAPFSVGVVPRAGPVHASVTVPHGFRTLLVATDFSELGNAALARAMALLPTGGVIHLVKVAEAPLPPAQEREELELLEALVPPDAERRGIFVIPHILPNGLIDTSILQAAERFGCELICVGSHGRSGLGRVLLGGVAQGVVKGADRPVLVIRPKAD